MGGYFTKSPFLMPHLVKFHMMKNSNEKSLERSMEAIIWNELVNDGRSVFLYYSSEIGLYWAFGLSAYYVDHVIEPGMAYSPEIKMPAVWLNKADVCELRLSLKMKEHREKNFYRFETQRFIGRKGYDRWVARVMKKTGYKQI